MSRVLAVARYEVHCHMTGRSALRLLGVAALLLLPASTIKVPNLSPAAAPSAPLAVETEADAFVGPPPPPKVKVRGEVPPALQARLESAERSPYELRGHNPVVVVAPQVSNDLRAALETLDGAVRLEVRSYLIPGRLPGRSLLIAILAISLLTGPLADALPGERARRTLEVLLTSGITRGELIGGKWLAWTSSAAGTAAIAAVLACLRGVQAPGWWLLGLPLFIGSAVAFGLWLVRLVDDVVGGSAAPMRVLPVAAGAMAAIALGLEKTSPLLAAAVPLGGPLMVAAGFFTMPSQALTATLGTIAFVLAVLTRTGRDLDRLDTSSAPNRWGAIGLSAVATVMWWLTVGGPGVWAGGASRTSDLVTAMPQSMLVGGTALLACAVIAIARESRKRPTLAAPSASAGATVMVTLAVGAALALGGPLPDLNFLGERSTLELMVDRLREGALPTAMTASAFASLAGLVSVFGQTVLFRAVVAKRSGWLLASLLWALAACPLSPWSAVFGSCALGALGAGYGWVAVLIAHTMWAIGASTGAGLDCTGLDGAAAALALQIAALTMALGAAVFMRGVPIRHQL